MMFDSYNLTNSIAIREHRAPTDESVRLLSEFEKAAQDKVISAQKLDNNLVTATIWQIADHMSYKNKYKILFKINGTAVAMDFDLDQNLTRQEALETFYNGIAKRISAEIMDSISKEVKV